MGSLRSLAHKDRVPEQTKPNTIQLSTFKDKNEDHIIGTLTGTFLVCGVPSKNKHVYPAKVLENILNDPQILDKIADQTLLGWITTRPQGTTTSNVTHIVAKIYEQPANSGIGMCCLNILDTPLGRNVKALIHSGMSLYPCLQSSGSILRTGMGGNQIVDPNSFTFHRIDLSTSAGWDHTIKK
jgi:hypothetical protein